MATYTWLLQTGGDFDVAANWTLDGINPAPTAPGSSDTADFDAPVTGTISGNPDVFRINSDNAASNWTFTGQATIFAIDIDGGGITLASGASITASGGLGVAPDPGSSGTFIVGSGASYHGTFPAQTSNYLFNIGNGAAATGTVIVQGPAALVDTGANGASIAIDAGGTGSLHISEGGVAKFATTNPNDLVALAVGRSGTGTVTVDGPGSQLMLTGIMYVGRGSTGNGTVTLTNGASLTETAVGVGFGSGIGSGGNVSGVFSAAGTGALNVLSGSTATFGDSLNIGNNGATGAVQVDDGTVTVDGLLRVGTGTVASGGNGTLTVSHGGVVRDTAAADTSTAYVLVGVIAGTTGTVGVNGWGSLLDAGANAIDVGVVGTGTLTASNGGLIRSTELTIGDRGNGTLDLTNGAAAIASAPSDNGSALSVGAQTGGTGSISVSGHGSALIAVGEAVLGGTDTGHGATAGGTADISVSQGGFLGTGGMTIESASSLGIDGASAAFIAGNLSDGGEITTSGLLTVTGTVSGAGSLTLDGGLVNLQSLDTTNVSFGGVPALLRAQALTGATTVSGMRVGDIFDLAGQQGVTLKEDTVTTKSGMLFLSAAPAGDSYRLIHSLDGTAVVLTPASEHGMSDMIATDTGPPGTGLDLPLSFSADLLECFGVNRDMGSPLFIANDERGDYVGDSSGSNPHVATVGLLIAHKSFAG